MPDEQNAHTFELGDNGTFVFQTVGEVKAYFKEERMKWQELAQHDNDLQQAFASLLNYGDPDNKPVAKSGIRGVLQASNDVWICSETPKGEFVLSLLGSHVNLALGAMKYLTKRTLPQRPDSYMLGGFVRAVLWETDSSAFERSFSKSASQLVNRLKEHRAQYERLLNELDESSGLFHQGLTDLRQKTSNALVELSKRTKLRLRRVRRASALGVEKATDQTHSRIEDLIKTYEEKVALSKPVEYWEEKVTQHAEAARDWWTRLLWTASITVVSMIAFLLLFLRSATDSEGVVHEPPLSKMAVAVFVVGIGLWIIRLVARQWISHEHLKTDASERVVLIKAYLALLLEPNALETKDRQLVLQSVFRPSSDGLVKEDGPSTPVEILLAKVKGQ